MQVLDFSPPAAAVVGSGQQFEVSWTVQNNGDVAVEPGFWFDSMYLSSDDVLDGTDQILSFEVAGESGLEVGESYTLSATITIPNTSAGSRFLILSVDQSNLLAEDDDANNIVASPIELSEPDVDLTIDSFTSPVATVVAGQPFQLNWSIGNTGSDDATAPRADRVYVSVDDFFDFGDEIIWDEVRSDGVPALGSAPGGALVTIPESYAPGVYYLFVGIDEFDEQFETNNFNNGTVLPIEVVDTAPDLTFSLLDAEPIWTPGSSVDVTYTVENTGSAAAAGSLTLRFFFSSDEALGDDDVQVGEVDTSSELPLVAGEDFTGVASIDVPAAPTGALYLLAVVDADYQVSELDESNNVAALEVFVEPPAVLDLAVSDLTAPASALLGSTIGVSYLVTNNSTSAIATPWIDRFFLSDDAILDASDVQVDPVDYEFSAGLGIGENQLVERTISIANASPGAGQFLLVQVGIGLDEDDASNNVAAVAIDVLAPDLDVTAFSAPDTVSVNQLVNIDWTVTNVGTSPLAGSWQDRVYLSSDPVLSEFDTVLHIESINRPAGLAANDSYSFLRSVSIPDVPAGSYYFFVRTLAVGVQDANAANNVEMLGPIEIGRPDLVIAEFDAPSVAIGGDTISITYTVLNDSDVPMGVDAIADRLVLSNDPIIDLGDTFLSLVFVGSDTLPLGPHESYQRTIQVPLAGNNIVGSKYLILRTDNFVAQGETDETNNTLAVPIEVSAPDLAVEIDDSPEFALLGTVVNVTYTVTNLGDVDALASNWVDRIYLSPDGVAQGTQLGNFSAAAFSPLGDGSSYTVTRSVTIPLGAATGPQFLRVVANADPNTLQPETDRDNNTAVVPIHITLDDVNLTIDEVDVPASVVTGQSFTVEWTVRNSGAGVALADWLDRVYLSDDDVLDAGDLAVVIQSAHTFSPLGGDATYVLSGEVTLANVAAGAKFLIVSVDDTASQPETSEVDNRLAIPITVAGPDLVVESIDAPAAVTFGEPFEVTYTVRNDGNAASNALNWFDRIILTSADASVALVLTDLLVTLDEALAPGATYTRTVVVVAPPVAAEGLYRIGVGADILAEQGELDENNNALLSELFPVALPPVPDLVVTSIVAPVEGFSGQQFALTWTVTNAGNLAAQAPWRDRVTLNGPQFVDFGLFEIVDSLAPGESITRTEILAFPLVEGEYFITVEADYENDVLEGPHEANTESTATFDVDEPPLPDLVVTQIVAPPDGSFSGTTVPITFTVMNIGDAATQTPVWTDYVFLSADPGFIYPEPGGDDLPILNQPYVPIPFANPLYLPPGESYTQTVDVSIPLEAAGPWYVHVFPNGLGLFHSVPFSQRESDRTNNLTHSAAFAVNLTPPPDLVVSQIIARQAVFSGETTEVEWTVENVGPGATAATDWFDRVYLSIDEVLDENDFLLETTAGVAEFFHTGRLESGEIYTVTQTLVVPEGISGSYYFLFATDPFEQVFEANVDANNVGSREVAVNLTPPPDLVVEAVSTTAPAQAAHAIDVTYTVSNLGNTDTPSTNSLDRIYLSLDNLLDEADILLTEVWGFTGVLAVGQSYTKTRTVTLPAGIEGEYFILVAANTNETVFEVDRDNNVLAGDALDVVLALPNLVVSEVAVESPLVSGQVATVQWTVQNTGAGDTAATRWIDKVFLSTDGTTAGGQLLGYFIRHGLLNPGESYTRSAGVVIPWDVEGATGIYVVTDAVVTVQEGSLVVALTGPEGSVFEGAGETDNTSALVPVDIVRQTADLAVTELIAPPAAFSGATVNLSWTVANLGAATNANHWIDDVYLSIDANLSAEDLFLGSVFRSGALGPGDSYLAARSVKLPNDLAAGSYFVLVQTDRTRPTNPFDQLVDRVSEGFSEANNLAASELLVSLAPAPDLVVSDVGVPATIVAGRTLEVSWTVANLGADASGSWRDAVYLSLDQVLDPAVDHFLGSVLRSGGLVQDGSYTQTNVFPIPGGLTGPYYVFVRTDSGDQLFEREGEGNNASYAPSSIDILLGQPVDFVVGAIEVPAAATAGLLATIGYTIANETELPVPGGWTDSIYLSADDAWDPADALFAQVQRATDLAAGEGYSELVTAPLPILPPGNYRVIIRTDVLNNVAETNDANNLGVSLDVATVDAVEIELGVPRVDPLSSGAFRLYRVDVAAGQTLRFSWDSADNAAATEMYVRFAEPPTRSNFDLASTLPFEPDQELFVPRSQEGTYYVLVHASAGVASGTVLVESLPFTVVSAAPGEVGNAGQATLDIRGGLFTRGTEFELLDPEGQAIAASLTIVLSQAQAYATFDLAGRAPGSYDLVARAVGGAVVTLEDAVQVVESLAGGDFNSGVTLPPFSLAGSLDSFFVTITNTGNNDLLAPMLIVQSPTGTLFGRDVAVKGPGEAVVVYAASDEGPAGILRPGQSITVSFVYQNVDEVNVEYAFEGAFVREDEPGPIDWNEVEALLSPELLGAADYPQIRAELEALVGSTIGDFVRMLSRNANLAPTLEAAQNHGALLSYEVDRATAAVRTSLAGRLVTDDLDIDLSDRRITAINFDTGERIVRSTLRDGSFLFEDLPAGTYELQADGVVTPPQFVVVEAGDHLTDFELLIERGLRVSGRVLVGVTPVAGASVGLAHADGRSAVAETDEQGNFLLAGLPEGIYSLTVSADGFAEFAIEDFELVDVDRTTTVVLTAESVIVGKVSLAPDGPLDTELVVVAVASDGATSSATTVLGTNFRLDELPAGTYDLAISRPGYVPVDVPGVVVAEGGLTNVGTIALARAAIVRGQVTSSDSLVPASQAEVVAYAGGVLVATAIAEADGSFVFDELAPGDYEFAVLSAAAVAPHVSVSVQAGENPPVALEVFSGGAVAGVVLDSKGFAVAGGLVSLFDPAGLLAVVITDDFGGFAFGELPLGDYEVVVAGGGEEARFAFTVDSLHNQFFNAELVVESAAEISGQLRTAGAEPIAGGTVRLIQNGQAVASAIVDALGNYRFLLAAGGTYDLAAVAPDATFAPQTVSLDAGETEVVDFVAGAASLSVAVTTEDVPAAGAIVGLLVDVAGDDEVVQIGVLDADGEFQFANLAAGTYRVEVVTDDGRGASAVIAIGEGAIESVVLVTAPLASLVGAVTDGSTGIAGARVLVLDPVTAELVAMGLTDATGAVSIPALPAGTYDLVVIADGFEFDLETGVAIAGETPLAVVLAASTSTLVVRALDAEGLPIPLAIVQVRDAANRVIAEQLVDALGEATVTTAHGTGLTVTVSADGYSPQEVDNVTLSQGQNVDLGDAALASVGVGAAQFGPSSDPPVGGLAAGLAAGGMSSLAAASADAPGRWARFVRIKGESLDTLKDLRKELVIPDPICPECFGAYAVAVKSVERLDKEIKKAEKLREVMLKSSEEYGNAANTIQREVEGYQSSFGAFGTIELLKLGLKNEAADFIFTTGHFSDAMQGVNFLLAESASQVQANLAAIAHAVEAFVLNLNRIMNGIRAKGIAVPSVLPAVINGLVQFAQVVDSSGILAKAQKLEKDIQKYEKQFRKAYKWLDFAKESIDKLKQCNWDYANCEKNWVPYPVQQFFRHLGHTGRRTDPNDIVGPTGYGDPRFVTAAEALDYTIRFENLETATLPVQHLSIVTQLDADLDFRTVRFGDFGWGELTVDIDGERPFLNERIDLTATLGFYVDVVATVDVETGLATWTITAIDPATGLEPLDERVGFLPPNNNAHLGEGFVTYSARPKSGSDTGTVIDAQATIVFDTEPPLDTPVWSNTLDVDAPSSQLATLPVNTMQSVFVLSWSAEDVAGGSGLALTTIYVSENGGAFSRLVEAAPGQREYLFEGTPGSVYRFFSVAQDNAGNRELPPLVADGATALLVNSAPFVAVPVADVEVDEDAADTLVDLSGTFGDVDIATSGDSLTLAVVSNTNPGLVSSVLAGSSLTLDYAADQHGQATITVRATDLAGEIIETSFLVTVAAVNDPPTVAVPIANVEVDEDAADTLVDLSGTFSDVDIATSGDSLTLAVVGNTNPGLVSTLLVGTSFTLDYAADQHGQATITVRATDLAGEFVETSFLVTVNQTGLALPFSDDFNRADGTTVGPDWLETLGNLGLDDGRVVLFQNTESTVVVNDLPATDVSLEADVDLTGAEIGRSIALLARSQGPGDEIAYWGVLYRSDSAYAAQIYKHTDGVATALRSVTVPGPVGTLRFEVFGTTLDLYFNDTLVTSVIDDSIQGAGAIGVRQTGGSLDNFAAVAAVPPLSENAVLPFVDDFNRPDNSHFGPVWTERSGDTGVRSNAAGLYANDSSVVTLNGVSAVDVSVSADIDVTGAPAQFSSGLLARYSGPGDANTYMARLYRSDGGVFAAQIWKNVGGLYTPLRSVLVPSGAGNLRFDVIGDELQLFFNGVLVASTIDSSITGPGLVGMRLAGGTLDNFSVDEATPAPTSDAELPFFDDFARANSSSLGEFWTQRAGDQGIQSEQLVLMAGETSVATLNGVAETDVEVRAEIDITSGGNAGLLARYSGPGDAHAYLGLLQPASNGTFAAQIWKHTGGDWQNLTHAGVSSGSGELRFLLEGDHLQLFFDDVLVGDVIDDSISGPGTVGVRQSGGTIDNFAADLAATINLLGAGSPFDEDDEWTVDSILDEMLK